MTDAPHPLAKELLDKLSADYQNRHVIDSLEHYQNDLVLIDMALAQARRETWEAAAKELSERYKDTEYNIQTELFIDWCRTKAKENL